MLLKGPDRFTSSQNLKNRFMWAGEKVHDCIKHTLKNLQRGISVLSPDNIVWITLDQMRDEFRSSRERRYRQSHKTCALFEHEYEVDIKDAQWNMPSVFLSLAVDIEDLPRLERSSHTSKTDLPISI